MSGEEPESRSERLRRRRGQRARDRDVEDAQEPVDGREDADEESSSTSGIKDNRTGVYLYLTEQQKKEIDRLYNVLKAEYEFEFDVEFQKNRHYYPLLVQHGLDGLDGSDASELREMLDSIS